MSTAGRIYRPACWSFTHSVYLSNFVIISASICKFWDIDIHYLTFSYYTSVCTVTRSSYFYAASSPCCQRKPLLYIMDLDEDRWLSGVGGGPLLYRKWKEISLPPVHHLTVRSVWRQRSPSIVSSCRSYSSQNRGFYGVILWRRHVAFPSKLSWSSLRKTLFLTISWNLLSFQGRSSGCLPYVRMSYSLYVVLSITFIVTS